jgi:hypothetical protein
MCGSYVLGLSESGEFWFTFGGLRLEPRGALAGATAPAVLFGAGPAARSRCSGS